MTHFRSPGFLLLTTLSLAACGGGDTDTTAASTSEATTTATTAPDTTTDEIPTTTATSDGSTSTATSADTTSATASTTDPTTTDATTDQATTGGNEVVIVPGFELPESVHWSANANAWFVSNIVGMPGMKDGNGYISKLNPDGSVAEMKWATGLDGPAGLREANGILYANDIDTVRSFSVDTALPLIETVIPGAMFLNDIVVGPDNYVYVSDTNTNTISRFQGAMPPEVVIKNDVLDAPNGLMFMGNQLYCGAIGSISDPMVLGELLLIKGNMATVQGSYEAKIDGIEVDGDSFLITEFSPGVLQRVSPDGTSVTLLHDFTADGLMSTADLGFNPDTRVVGIPDLLGGQVAFWTVP